MLNLERSSELVTDMDKQATQANYETQRRSNSTSTQRLKDWRTSVKELDLAKMQIIQEAIAAALDIILHYDFDSAEEHIRTASLIHERNKRMIHNHHLQLDEVNND
jgi:Na+/phosphate symporter